MASGNRFRAVSALGVAIAIVSALGSVTAEPAGAAVPPAPGTISTWAGGTGEGPGLNVSVRPSELAAQGPFVYITDDAHDAARVLDTRTGELRTAAGNGDAEPWADQTPLRDGIPATEERIDEPSGVAADAAGNVYVSDYGDNRVRRVDPAGIISTFVGTEGATNGRGDGGPATEASLVQPSAIALDAAGNAYVLEGGSMVRRVSTGGTITTVAGCACGPTPWVDVPATQAGLVSLSALAVDPAGHLYIANPGIVLRVDDDGILRHFAGGGSPTDGLGDGGPATQATVRAAALAFDPAGNLYIADLGGRIRKVDAAGVITTVAGGGNPVDGMGDGGPATAASIDHPEGVAVGPGGDLYISDTYHMRVRKVSGGVITTVAGTGWGRQGGDGGPALKAQFSNPQGLARDATGNVFVADKENHRIRRVDGATGMVATVAGTGVRGLSDDGGAATATNLFDPRAVATDTNGNLFITESYGDRVRKVDTAGIISTVAGGGTAFPGDGGRATDAALRAPAGLATDAAGNLYIADVGHDLIRKVTPAGTISTVAGDTQPPPGGSALGDHGPARNARLGLTSASALAFDALGQLHLTGAELVRKVDLAGTITTVAGGGQAFDRYVEGERAHAIRFGEPTGITFDSNGSLYVVDADSEKIWMVDTMGRLRRVAGTGDINTGLGDGGPATRARIDLGISGMAFDAEGNLYVVDSHNHRIRRIETPFTPTRVLGAGWNSIGQVGDGTTTDRYTFVPAGSLANVTAVGAGYYHSLAVRADGTVWAWGWNYFGQLGDGTTTDRRGPVQVRGLDHVVAVAGGAYHSLALRADGTVWAWGWNGVGQLGDGTTTDRRLPVQVLGVSNVREISAGLLHNLALTHGGAVRAWGWNHFGQLGTGSLSQLEATPVPVPGASGALSIAAGAAHSLAARHLGDYDEVWGWGWNGLGQVGDGTTVERRVPVKTKAEGNRVWAGAYHSFSGYADALRLAWGYNAFGQLGARSSEPTLTTPTYLVPAGVDSVAPGALHTVMVTATGSVLASGWNVYGMLGDGTTVDRKSPATVPGVTGADVAAAGALHTVVIR